MTHEVIAQLKKAYYAGYEECEKGDANCFTGWREWASQLQSPMRWETLARIEENKSVLSMAERHMDERACVVIKQRIFNLEQQLDESQEEGLCDAKPIGYEKLLMPESTQEEYAAQSKGMRWGSEDKPDLAHEALERNYPEREGAFGSTWTDGYMQCMRDIENGDLKSQSTQEGGTVEATDRMKVNANEFINQAIAMIKDECKEEWLIAGYNGIVSLLQYAKESNEYASQVSATDKARITELEKACEEYSKEGRKMAEDADVKVAELEKEVERVGIMLVKAMGEVNDRDLEVERLRGLVERNWTDDLVIHFTSNIILGNTNGKLLGEYMKEFKANNNLLTAYGHK